LTFVVAPRINEIVEKEYNTSDSVTCTAEGIPPPSVSWIRISGSMPKNAGVSGRGRAVLRNLQDGDHIWMCSAENEVGADNVTVAFTGAFSVCLCVTMKAGPD